MNAPEKVLHRLPGDGWLVLAGSHPELGGETADLMDRLLERMDLARPVAAIAGPESDPEEVNEVLEAIEEWLGAEAGYLELDADLPTEGWEDSGLLLLIGDDPELWVESLRGEPGERLLAALRRGTLILAVGGAAAAFGSACLSAVRPDTPFAGLSWIRETLIVNDAEEAHGGAARSWVQAAPKRVVLVLEPGSILALGPDDKVEGWGRAAPEVILGKGWAAG